MKVTINVYDALPCETEEFIINGVEAKKDWFVSNYDNDDGEEIEYGCNNRVTDKLDISEVRNNLPESLKSLTDNEIKEIQVELEEKLVSGGCGWCV